MNLTIPSPPHRPLPPRRFMGKAKASGSALALNQPKPISFGHGHHHDHKHHHEAPTKEEPSGFFDKIGSFFKELFKGIWDNLKQIGGWVGLGHKHDANCKDGKCGHHHH